MKSQPIDYKRIAVVCSDIGPTLQWLLDKHRKTMIVEYDMKSLTLRVQNVKYYLIAHKQKALGVEFDTYIVSPFYETLLDVVKSRVRNRNVKIKSNSIPDKETNI